MCEGLALKGLSKFIGQTTQEETKSQSHRLIHSKFIAFSSIAKTKISGLLFPLFFPLKFIPN